MASKRKRLSVAEKAGIIKESRRFSGSKNQFAKSLGLPSSTLNSILKQQKALEKKSNLLGNVAKDRKTLKASPYDKLEKVLVGWIHQARAAKLPVNGTILRMKALQIASDLEMKGFTASNGWVDRFKKRNNLSLLTFGDELPAIGGSDPAGTENARKESEKVQFPDEWLKMANKRKRLSVAQKKHIMEAYREFGGTKNELAKSLGLSASTLGSILRQQTDLELRAHLFKNAGEDRKTLKASPYSELENILVEWTYQARAGNFPINASILQEKATEFSALLNLEGFCASSGWVERFKQRHGLTYRSELASPPVEIECVPEQTQYCLPSDDDDDEDDNTGYDGFNGYPPQCGNDSIISEVQQITALKEAPYNNNKSGDGNARRVGDSKPAPSFDEALNGLELLEKYFEAHGHQQEKNLSVLRNALFNIKSKQDQKADGNS